jgi:radical SAM protein (TIGR01212 family)
VFDKAMKKLKDAGIYTVVHMIVGLPDEDASQTVATAKYIAASGADGIKIALLHVLENTDLALHYRQNEFTLPTLDEYLHILGNIIEVLPPDMAVHRLTGDAPKRLLIAPMWSADKKHVYNSITKYFKENRIIQGRLYNEH